MLYIHASLKSQTIVWEDCKVWTLQHSSILAIYDYPKLCGIQR